MNQLTVDPIRLELGFDLVPLAKQNLGGTLVERIGRLREEILLKIGILIPPIRLRDNFVIQGHEFVVFIKGIKASQSGMDRATNSTISTAGVPDESKFIIEHLRELFLTHAPELMDFEQMNYLLEQHAIEYPHLFLEFNRIFSERSSLLSILRILLREKQSIRNFPAILETLLEIGPKKPVEKMVDLVRTRLECQSIDLN